MLSANDIHFLIEQEVNLGSFQYRDWEPEELDEAVNRTVFKLVNLAISKDRDKRENIETLLLRGLTKNYSQAPIKNEVDLPEDYTSWISAKSFIIRTTCCTNKVTQVTANRVYQVVDNVLYNERWYKQGEVFIGNDRSDFFGTLNEVDTKEQNAIFIESDLFNSFPTSLTTPYFTIIGNRIRIKSRQPVSFFSLDYIASITDFKLDSCKEKTLNLPENIQRWVIQNAVLDLAVRNEEPQQKILNMK